MNKAVIVLFTLAVFLSTVFAQSEAKPVIAKGVGDIVGGRKDIAREKALEDALRRAVEQAVGTFISSDAMVENGVLLSEKIYKESKGFVKSYEVVEETVDEKSQLVWVTIKAEVLMLKLSESLKQLISQVGTIRLLYAVTGETELISALKEDLISNGIEVVDPGLLKNVLDRQKAALANEGVQEAIGAGMWFWARYVLRGSVQVFQEPDMNVYGTWMKVTTLKYHVEIIDVTTAVIVASLADSFTNTGGTVEVAVKKCVNEAFNRIAGKIPRRILEYQASKHSVILVARNVPDLWSKLRMIPGISGLELTEKLASEERYQFRYDGDLKTLEKRLMEFGYMVKVVDKTFYVTYSNLISVTVTNATFSDLKKIRENFEVEQSTYSQGTIKAKIKGDAYNIAKILESLGFEIVDVTELGISCRGSGR